ncbi:MAG: hypothetical protein Q7S36_03645 [Candidatus Liptonbacteria bacterium]|nr:hypothetical protein [Candidatus Liptonbacteria bacterium]
MIIDPVNANGGGTQNIYVLMLSDILPTSTPVTQPPGAKGKVTVISPKNIGGYVSVADGKNTEVRADFEPSDLPTSAFNRPYSVNASGTVVFSPSQNSSGKEISVFKAEVKLPKDFGSPSKISGTETSEGKANRFFVSVADGAGRMRVVAINRQTSCEYPNGGDWAPDTECNISYVGGVDNGNLNFSGGASVTLDAPFAINEGKNINISGLGALAVNITSGGLKSGFVWRSFDDKNGSVQKTGDSAPAGGYYRRSLFPNPLKFRPKDKEGLSGSGETLGKFKLSESEETFSVTEKDSVWPKIYQATIDPPDVHVGDTQTLDIVVQAEAGQNIVSVVAEIETDKDTVNLPLALQGETAEADIRPNPYYVDKDSKLAIRTPEEMLALRSFAKQNLRGITAAAKADSSPKYTYSGSWIVKDTHDTKYHTTFIVTDSSGRVNKVTLAWSDACAIPNSGSWNLGTFGNCAISSTDGVENGTVTIATYTLTLTATFAFNPTQSVVLTSGAIVTGVNGRLVKTNLWKPDADIDNYPESNTQTAQDTAPANGRRRYLLNTAVDCNGGTPALYQNLSGYVDNDGDTYTVSAMVCSGATLPPGNSVPNGNDCNDSFPAGWQNRWQDMDGDNHAPNSLVYCVGNQAGYVDGVAGNSDCYDFNNTVYPGSTWYSIVNRGDGSFDYNCVNGEEKAWPNSASSGLGGGQCADIWNGCFPQSGNAGWSDIGGLGGGPPAPACGVSGYYETVNGGQYSGSGNFDCFVCPGAISNVQACY